MPPNGFAVDTPFTDLDTDRDFENFEVDNNNYDQDNLSIDLNGLEFGYRPNMFIRSLRYLSSLFTKRRSIDEFNLDDLDNNEGFNLDDDFLFSSFKKGKGRNRTIWGVPGGIFIKSAFIAVIGLLIAIVVLLAGRSSGLGSDLNPSLPIDVPHKYIYSNGTDDYHNTTILVSIDGFHPHYISKKNTPFLSKLYGREAYISPYMSPTNPSVTFTNHWTLVTGLKPIYHGIIGNHFYSPLYGESFSRELEESLDPKWWGGEPIWSTARKQGVKVATHMWPGSEVLFGNDSDPNYVNKFNVNEDLDTKLGKLKELLEYPIEKRPQLLLSYLPIVDTLGHKYGVAGTELKKGLKQVDKFIENLYSYLERFNLLQITNVVIVSDHGMSPTSADRIIYLDDLVDQSKIEHFDAWPLYGLRPFKDADVDHIFNYAKAEWQLHPFKEHFNVYRKEEIIDEIFGGSDSQYVDRIAPIWIIPKIGYSISTRSFMENHKNKYEPKGVHGYDKKEVLMRSLFMGFGPYFEKKLGHNHKVKPFDNVEIYNIICQTLYLNPSENNGTLPSILSEDHILESGWTDNDVYPNVDFEIEILKEKSIYDELFVKHDDHKDGKSANDDKEDDSDDSDDSEEEEEEEEEEEVEEEEHDDDDDDKSVSDAQAAKNTGSVLNPETTDSGNSTPTTSQEPSTMPEAQQFSESAESHGDSHFKTHKGNSTDSKVWKALEDTVNKVEEFVEDKIDDIEEFIEEHQHNDD